VFFHFRSMINGVKHLFYRPSCRQKLKRCSPKLFYVGQKERERKSQRFEITPMGLDVTWPQDLTHILSTGKLNLPRLLRLQE
jgi:hypothetical protein